MAKVIFTKLASANAFWNGLGFIAGTSPLGLVTVNGSPGAREVEVRHRKTRMPIATTFSAADGTYRFDGLNPDEEFDVIARDWAGTYNDAILARVKPYPYDVKSSTGSFTVNDTANTLDGAIAIFGGDSGHTVSVVSGTAPSGITFSVVTGGPPTYASLSRWLIASGTASAGSYTWTLRVTAPNGSRIDIACTATFT
ncbi:MAG: hypothetical protein ACTHK2_05035 [Dokdonella sp.]|uniref:hypothetical protein n=1 Tax=Dokdonella sp. TaxID=2291710 RepID=UPI003F80C2D9